jgi:hypothetical protein
MSAIVLHSAPPSVAPEGLIGKIRAAEPRLFALALLMLAAMAPTGFAAFVDQREFLGVGIWLKPLKFEFALFVYFATLAFYAMFLPKGTTGKRWYRIFTAVAVFATVGEMVWIGGAALIGTASHFNTTPVGAVIYPAMGLFATLITTTSTIYAVNIARNAETGLSPAVKEALVIGLALVLPLTLVTAGTMSGMSGHLVGSTAGDAGGVTLMGWSREAGDLRVAHFFATHALHFIPAFGLLSASLFGPSRRAPVRIFSAAFVALVAFVFIQALNGQPFIG